MARRLNQTEMDFDRPISEELRDAQPSRSLIVLSSSLSTLASSGLDSAILEQIDRGKKIKGWIFETDHVSGISASCKEPPRAM